MRRRRFWLELLSVVPSTRPAPPQPTRLKCGFPAPPQLFSLKVQCTPLLEAVTRRRNSIRRRLLPVRSQSATRLHPGPIHHTTAATRGKAMQTKTWKERKLESFKTVNQRTQPPFTHDTPRRSCFPSPRERERTQEPLGKHPDTLNCISKHPPERRGSTATSKNTEPRRESKVSLYHTALGDGQTWTVHSSHKNQNPSFPKLHVPTFKELWRDGWFSSKFRRRLLNCHSRDTSSLAPFLPLSPSSRFPALRRGYEARLVLEEDRHGRDVVRLNVQRTLHAQGVLHERLGGVFACAATRRDGRALPSVVFRRIWRD